MMFTAQLPHLESSVVIRYPRGNGVLVDWRTPFREIPIGRGRLLREGTDVAILTIGHPGNFAVKAAEMLQQEGVSVLHADLRWAKPLDENLLHSILSRIQEIITVEDGTILGGFGSAVAEFAAEHGYNVRITRLGMPDRILEHGEQSELYAECGFDAPSIAETVRVRLATQAEQSV